VSNSLPQFEAAYAGEPIGEGMKGVPWNIGEPQPAIAELIDAGRVSGDVLDAGCGVGETALRLTALGYTAVGVDSSPTAIAQARASAASRGLGAEFYVEDITSLSGFDGRFNTVIDSTLFHSLPVDARSDYLASIARSAAPGAVYHALVFSRDAPFPEDAGPNSVDERELREAVSPYWAIDEVSAATIAAFTPEQLTPGLPRDAKGRALLPAFLLTAHLPG
jgi:SAM-dependent methyltransferase